MLEWTGSWSDSSPELLKHNGITELETGEGEWWMQYSDLLKYFTMIEFCHLLRDWKEISFHGCWSWETTFHSSFTVQLTKHCTIFISLEQKGRREMRDEADSCLTEIPIQLQVFPVVRNKNFDQFQENLVQCNDDFQVRLQLQYN